ncbi:hypothetical protein E6O75_ATG04482 [Venturia nashicola]|uniref:VPS9 domain-containing protein n=1 Tax=Venturia nashicola TaxID=86259 RepID=A0A4Z1P826_9PEZI|nr:hypothetical protein E6O75_ATG04482 [Venturia nashicola]
MQRNASWDVSSRPKAQNSKSFSRLSSPPRTPTETSRARAATTQGSVPEIQLNQNGVQENIDQPLAEKSDIFSTAGDDEPIVASPTDVTSPTFKPPETFEELPIEIRSLTDRFLESLSAKIHPTPLSIDTLSEMFQDFYIKADSHIATHIATLSSRISRREKSPTPSVASRTSTSSKAAARKETPSRKVSGDQQMLSATEIADRKKARRLLELKKVALEEAVEKAVVGRLYARLYRHRSADDEERDQKLRSRIAALSLVGIGLKELLAGADEIPDEIRKKTVDEQDYIKDLLAGARKNIQDMDNEIYPLGKLQHLSAAHKSIVETLSKLFPSSSSADEILPTLIYALITSPPEHVNVISNLKFIQRFRAAGKVDGEAAYCLVNLEAAASFLETVDLPSLRADESPQGPQKHSHPSTPRTDSIPMSLGITPADDPATGSAENLALDPSKPLPSPVKQQRRLSNLIQMQSNKINEASDSIRDAVLESADSAFDTINNTLESSFKFLFGRMREHQEQSSNESGQEIVLPKTLEDARKLVTTPTPPPEEADDVSVGMTSSPASEREAVVDDPLSKAASEDKLTELFAGRRSLRERSADSNKSGGSSKRVAFEAKTTPSPVSTSMPPPTLSSRDSNPAVESMRSFGNTINPLNQFSRMSGLFGRTTPAVPSQPLPSPTPLTTSVSESTLPMIPGSPPPSKTASDNQATAAIEELKKATPPNKRFVECKDAKELKLGEVEELLKDYQRLVALMGKAVS